MPLLRLHGGRGREVRRLADAGSVQALARRVHALEAEVAELRARLASEAGRTVAAHVEITELRAELGRVRGVLDATSCACSGSCVRCRVRAALTPTADGGER